MTDPQKYCDNDDDDDDDKDNKDMVDQACQQIQQCLMTDPQSQNQGH